MKSPNIDNAGSIVMISGSKNWIRFMLLVSNILGCDRVCWINKLESEKDNRIYKELFTKFLDGPTMSLNIN